MSKFNIIIKVDSEDCARQRALEWFAQLPNLTVDKVTPSKHGGYQVSLSYDEENSK